VFSGYQWHRYCLQSQQEKLKIHQNEVTVIDRCIIDWEALHVPFDFGVMTCRQNLPSKPVRLLKSGENVGNFVEEHQKLI
jgi:hypothetical protein